MDKQNIIQQYAALTGEKALKKSKSSLRGLTTKEAKRRLRQYGLNVLIEAIKPSVVWEFLAHFKSPLTIILIIATIISAVFGEAMNAMVIGAIVFLSVALEFLEEHHANSAAQKLKQHLHSVTTVVRDGKQQDVSSSHICVGDIIFLNAGDLIPADARIIKCKNFFVNQAALTGESFPGEKSVRPIKKTRVSLDELDNIVFSGTNVVSGTATVMVIAIGKDTEFGKIADTLEYKTEKSDFEIGVGRFGFLIMKVVLVLVLLIFFLNALINHSIIDSFLFALAIAVGVTPELLPVIMSVTMTKGSQRMAKKGVIVKKMAAIPNLGGMNILCVDKTGTLTEDCISVVRYTDIDGHEDERVLARAYLNSSYQTGVTNLLERAILQFKTITLKGYSKIDEIPFDFNRRIMSVIADSPDGRILVAKGAPEEILKCCVTVNVKGKQVDLQGEVLRRAQTQYEKFSAEGFRVLAIAEKMVDGAKKTYISADEERMNLLGLVAFLDPPKKDVKEVLKIIEDNGVEIKILTGDNELVARKICEEVGLGVGGMVLGKDIDKMSDLALRRLAVKTTLFARFSPEQKNRVIKALRFDAHVVGYLGDGINDALALKTSDVGISVAKAVDVAREAADVILTEKSLRVLNDGIMEGRKTFGNTMKYIMMGLSSNFGNMFSVLAAVFFLPFLPMLPAQILLNNLIYDFSQLTLPSDNVDADWIKKPRRWSMKFVKRFMLFFGPISSFYDILTFVVLFVVFQAPAATFQTGWFIESLATQTLVIHIIRTRQLPFVKSTASKALLISTIVCVVVGWLIPLTFVGRWFNFTPLPWYIMATMVGIVVLYLLTVEATKRIFYRRYDFDTK